MKPRLNPFALPPETNGRFLLLALLSLALAFQLGRLLFESWVPDTGGSAVLLQPAVPPVGGGEEEMANYARTTATAQVAAIRWQFQRLVAPVAAMLLLTLTAWLLYRRHPARVRRLGGETRPLPAAGELAAGLQELADRAGLLPSPGFELAVRGGDQGGQAFGLAGSYVVQLGDRSRLVFARSRALFNAVVLHELAHIVNGDLGRSYFTESLWRMLGWGLALPVGVSFAVLMARSTDSLAELGPKLLWFGEGALGLSLITLVTLAVRASVLRVRELYADARVAVWGAADPLQTRFRSAPAATAAAWRGVFRLHPTAAERAAALADATVLFRLHPGLALATGILLGLLVQPLSELAMTAGSALITAGSLAMVARIDSGSFEAPWLLSLAPLLLVLVLLGGPLLLGGLLMLVVGRQVQRTTLAAAVSGTSTPSLVTSALALGAGWELGLALTLYSFRFWFGEPRMFVVSALSAGAVGLVGWMSLQQVSWATRRWLPGWPGSSPPTVRRRWVLAGGAVMFGAFVLPLLAVRTGTATRVVNETNQATALGFLALALTIASGLAAAVWVMTWWLSRPQAVACPDCAVPLTYASPPVLSCPHCGARLGRWLLLEPPGEPAPPPLPPPILPPPLPPRLAAAPPLLPPTLPVISP